MKIELNVLPGAEPPSDSRMVLAWVEKDGGLTAYDAIYDNGEWLFGYRSSSRELRVISIPVVCWADIPKLQLPIDSSLAKL